MKNTHGDLIEPRIGLTFTNNDNEGTILQSSHTRQQSTGVGPFYGVQYEYAGYMWYEYSEIKRLLNFVEPD